MLSIRKVSKIEVISKGYNYFDLYIEDLTNLTFINKIVKEDENINIYVKSDLKVPFEDYIVGVIAGEMPVTFELEALKAQAVVARTYTIFKVINSKKKHGEADICDDSICCQAWISKEDRFSKWEKADREKYWEKIVNAVNTTQGKMITFEGKPINAFFHSNSGGATEAPINVWGGSGYPYLQTVETSGENTYSQYSSKLTITKNEFKEKIKNYIPILILILKIKIVLK